jgi:hypothetical protein
LRGHALSKSSSKVGFAGHWYPAEIVDMDADGSQVFVKTHPRSEVRTAAKVRLLEQPVEAVVVENEVEPKRVEVAI